MNNCDARCPLHFTYCDHSHICAPSWMPCGGSPISPKDNDETSERSIITLPHMFIGNMSSREFPVSVLSGGQSIGITFEPSEQDQRHGEWQYNYDGDWHSLSNAPSRDKQKAVKLHNNAKLRYVPSQGSMNYGLRVLNFFPHSSVDRNGVIVDIPGLVSFEIALLLIHPIAVPSGYSLVHHSAATKKIEVQEDQFFSQGLPIADLVHVHVPIPMLKNPVPSHMLPFVDEHELEMFERSVKIMEQSRPVAVVRSDVKDKGNLRIYFPDPNTNGSAYIVPTDDYYVPLDYANASLLFVPVKDYHGSFTVNLEICSCLATAGSTGGATNNNSISNLNITTISLTIDVLSVNDQPEVSSPLLFMPALPYADAITTSNAGYLVSDLINQQQSSGAAKFGVRDIETSSKDLGLAVFSIPESVEYGKWQYQALDGTWHDINNLQNDDVNPFVLVKEHEDRRQEMESQSEQSIFGGYSESGYGSYCFVIIII